VIVAVSPMEVVEMAIHQVINVISVGYCRVATVPTVHVRLLMSGAVMVWCAFLRINRGYLNAVIVHVIAVRMMQVAIMKIVDVAIVLYRDMTTVRAMLMAVRT